MRVLIFISALALMALCALIVLVLSPSWAIAGPPHSITRPLEIFYQQGILHMSPLTLVIIFILFAIPLAALIGAILLAALKVLKGNEWARGDASDAEETRLIQELHRGLNRMEERVEALETLLMEKSDRRKTHE